MQLCVRPASEQPLLEPSVQVQLSYLLRIPHLSLRPSLLLQRSLKRQALLCLPMLRDLGLVASWRQVYVLL